MNEDDARFFKMRHGWERTFARHVVTSRAELDRMLADGGEELDGYFAPRGMPKRLLEGLVDDLREELYAAGWPRRRALGAPPNPITFAISDQHADYWTPGLGSAVAVLAEVRALELLTPSPIPKLVLWPRLGPFLDVLTELP